MANRIIQRKAKIKVSHQHKTRSNTAVYCRLLGVKIYRNYSCKCHCVWCKRSLLREGKNTDYKVLRAMCECSSE